MTFHGRCVVCIHSCTLRPGRTSITKNGLPSASWPKSRARTMAGWFEERDGARLLVKPPALLRARLALLGRAQALERDAVAGDDVLAQVHDAHAAATELAHDLVAVREDRSDLARRRAGALVLTCGRHGANASLARLSSHRHWSSRWASRWVIAAHLAPAEAARRECAEGPRGRNGQGGRLRVSRRPRARWPRRARAAARARPSRSPSFARASLSAGVTLPSSRAIQQATA